MIQKLVTAVTGGTDWGESEYQIFECDRCGVKVDHPESSCPNCEDSRIVTYII